MLWKILDGFDLTTIFSSKNGYGNAASMQESTLQKMLLVISVAPPVLEPLFPHWVLQDPDPGRPLTSFFLHL